MLYEHLTPTQAVAVFGVSRQWIYQLLARYKAVGLQALEPISRRPHSNPRCLSNGLLQEIITLRRELLLQDLVTPQSKKRPKAYIQSFKAVQPNETWQFDFTHLRPCDGSDVEIIYWLDDHSRLLLSCSVYKAITGKIKRFHQTLKKWLSQQSPAKDLKELQRQLDQFGKLTLRRAGKVHHLGVGIENQFKKVYVVVDHYKVTVVEKKTGEVLSKHIIEPTRTYWTNFLMDEETKRTRRPK